MSTTDRNKTHRLHMVVTQGVRDRIEALQKRSDCASLTETIRRALAVYDEFLTIKQEGKEIIVRDPVDGKEQRLRII